MVWGSIAGKVEDGSIDTTTSAGLEEGYPMYLLPTSEFLKMNEWRPHQDLLAEGKLKVFDESKRGRVLFCSHQWCSYVHPDPGGDQLEALKGVITKLAAGTLVPRGNGVVELGFGLKMGRSASEWVSLMEDAYIWFDFVCMPQPLAASAKAVLTKEGPSDSTTAEEYIAPHSNTDHREYVAPHSNTDHREYVAPHSNTDHRIIPDDAEFSESSKKEAETIALIEQLKRAVDSIPSYIERSSEMLILVPSVKHADRTDSVCDFNTWRQRGWCRMEFVSSRLCCANDIPCMVISSRDKTPEYFNLCDTMRLFAGHGNFTVDADRAKVAGVLEKMIEAKAVSEYEKGNLGLFRAYLTLSSAFLMGLPTAMEMPEDLTPAEAVKAVMKWRDDKTEAAWMEATGCSPLHIACGLGRTDAVRELLADPAMAPYLNTRIKHINKGDAGAGDKSMGVQTITASCKDISPLAAALLCGDEEMIKLLIQSGAKPTHHDFGVGCSMGNAANMAAFLRHAPSDFDINSKKSCGMMSHTAMHQVCLFSDGAEQADKIRLLLQHGAAPSLHARSLMGQTPLSCLAANQDADPDCVKLLVDAGAEVEAHDKPGAGFKMIRGTLATLAKTRRYAGFQMMVDMCGYGRAPLHHAAQRGNVSMIRALHEVGARMEKTDSKSQSALTLITKAMPDSHAPELLSDVLQPKIKLKGSIHAALVAPKLRQNLRNKLVPRGSARVVPGLPQVADALA